MINNYTTLNSSDSTRFKKTWKEKFLFFVVLVLFSVLGVSAQVTTNGGSGLNPTYLSLADAITALNTTPITSPVVITLDAANPQTAPVGGYSITATGTAANTITILGNSNVITAQVGTNTPASATLDGILKLVGSDYVTISGFTFTDANLTNPATMEYGIGLFKASATDGASNNTIQNCTFNMQRINNVTGAGAMVEGSVGILMINANTTSTTALTVTAASGTNSNNKFYTNTINGGNYGIALIGFAASTPFTLADTNNDVGGSSSGTGNLIKNFGGAAASTNPAAGIRTLAQYGLNVSYNTINNNDGSGVNHVSTLRGIYLNTATSASATISFNNVFISSGATTSLATAIDNQSGSTAASNTININNNIVSGAYTTSTTGVWTGINNGSSAATVNINFNTIGGFTLPGTGIHVMIETGSPVTVNTNNNIISNISRSGASGSWRGIKTTSPTNWNASNNTIENLSWTLATSTGSLDAFYSFTSAVNVTITNNIIRNLSTPTTGTITGINEFGVSGLKTYQNNQIYNFFTTAGGVGGATFRGISESTGSTNTYSGNQIYALNSTGSTGGTSGTIVGITFSSGTANNVFNNKIYDLSSTSTNPTVAGITTAGGTTNTVYNNIIGDLRAPAANASNPVIGLNISSGTTANVYSNTVYLNASSSGALFGSSAISASTTPNLTLRNNIFVNNSTFNGAAFAAAYRRSSTTLTTYGAASNNNLFYAASPTHVYYDGSLSKDLPAFKLLVAARDSNSFTTIAIPSFLNSTVGANANFLHIDPTVGTQIESGGTPIAGITTDFDGDTRNVSTPDIGADEFAGTSPAPLLTGLVATPSGTQCSSTPHVVSVDATTPSGTILGVTLNYAFNGVAQTAIAMTNSSGSTWTGTIPVATPANALVTYSVTAQNSPLLLSASLSGTSYKDAPLFGTVVNVSPATPQICGGTGSATLTLSIAGSGTPTYTAPPAVSNPTTDEDLGNVTITQGATTILNNTSAINSLTGSIGTATGTVGSYSNFTSYGPYALTAGQTYNFSLSSLQATTAYSNSMAIYIDYNRNGLFNDSGEAVYIAGATVSGAHTETGSFTVPASVSFGLTRMRVINNEGLITSPTQSLSYGEYEEYSINLQPNVTSYSWLSGATEVGNSTSITVSPASNTTYTASAVINGCSVTSAPVTVAITTTPTAPSTIGSVQCGPGVPTASVTSTSALPNPTFKWYADNTTTTALQTSTSSTFTASLNATTTFFVSEANGICESPRTPVTVTVNTPPTLTITGQSIFCGVGGNGTITAASNDPAMTFVWTSLNPTTGTVVSTSNGVLNYNVTATTLFRVVGTPVSNPLCSPITIDYSVSVFDLPTTVLTAPDGVCPGGSAIITSDLSSGSFQSVSIPHAPLVAPATATTLVTGGAAVVPLGGGSLDDGGWGAIPLGFDFNFFGTQYNNINVGTNGTVQFGPLTITGGLADYTFNTLPSTSEPFNMVALLAMDYDVEDGGTIKYWTEGTAPNRKFVVSYEAVREFFDTKVSTSQAIFYETTGIIEVHVTFSDNVDRNKLVGVNNGNGTVGTLAYASGTAVTTNPQNPITNPFAYRFTPPYNYTTNWSYQNSTTGGNFVPFGTPNGFNQFTQSVNPTENTVYSLSYTNITTGCTNTLGSAQVTLNVLGTTSPATTAVASVPALCLGTGSASLSLTGAVNSIGSATGLTYQWQVSTAGGPFANVASAGTSATYTATPTVTSTYQCLVTACGGTAVASSPVTVTVNVPGTISIAPNVPVCAGNSAVLTAATVTGTMTSYVWSPTTELTPPTDGASVTVTPSANRSYSVYAIDSNNCQTPTVTTTVIVNPFPAAVSVTANAALPFINNTICYGATVELTATGGGTTPIYTWTTSPATQLYTDSGASVPYTTGNFAVLYAKPTVATTFTASVTELGCTTPGYVAVGVTPLPVFTVAPTTICKGGSGTLNITSAQDNTYTWSPPGAGGVTTSANTFAVDPTVTTVYTVTGTSNTTTPACSSAPTLVTVTVSDPGSIQTQPVNSIASVGNGTTFTVAGSAGVTYGYQWQIRTSASPAPDGTWANLVASANYSGVNLATLTVSLAGSGTAINNARYRCILTPPAPCANLTSAVALLTVSTTGIVTSPENFSVCLPSSTAQFTVVTNGTEPFNAQWLVNAAGGTPTTSLNLYTQSTGAYNGPNTTLVPGLTFEHPLDVSTGLRNIKVLLVSGINSTTFNNLKVRVTLNNTLQSAIATLSVSNPVDITTDVSTTPVKLCRVTASTNFSIVTSGTVGSIEWKYATSAAGPYTSLAANTPAGTTYANATTPTLTVNTTAGTPAGNYFYKAFVTGGGSGAGKCPDDESAAANITVISPTIGITASSPIYCAPGTGVTLTGTKAINDDSVSYTWTATGFSTTTAPSIIVQPSVTTTYNVSGTDINGCTNTASVSITVAPAISATASASLATVCPSTTIDLFGNASLAVPYSGPAGVGSYTFENATAPFTTIVGGTGTSAVTLTSGDDSMSTAQTLPFTFNFGGNNFSGYKINSNGWLTFDTSATTGTNYTALSGTVNNVIAAFNRDLNINNTTATTYYVQTSGSVGSRITKVEWANIRSFSSTANPASGNVQIWLYEGTNRVEIRYGAFTSSSGRTGTGITCQVGLRGTSTGVADVRALSTTLSWAAPTATTASGSTMALGTFASPILPDSGRLYRFTPPGIDTNTYTYAWTSAPAGFSASTKNASAAPAVTTTYNLVVTSQTGCSAPASTTVNVSSALPLIGTQPLAQQLCEGVTATLSVVATSATPLTYQWYKGATALTNGGTISGATSATLTITGVLPADSGNYRVDISNCSTVSSDIVALFVNPKPTATIAGSASVCLNSASQTVTFTGANGTSPYTFTYKLNGGSDQTIVSTGNVATITVPTNLASTFAYTLVSVQDSSSTTCTNPQSGSATVTVNPLPIDPVLSSNSPVCEGSTLNLNATVAPLSGYVINSNSGVSFIDISTTGTTVGSISDDSEHNITIPSFNYNGVTYTTARVSNNGVLVFGATTGDIYYGNAALPQAATSSFAGLGDAGAAALCVLWDDLTPGTGGSIRTQTIGNKFIVQWTQEDNFSATGTGTVTFQAQLDTSTGQIIFVYPDVLYGVAGFDNAQTATVGLNYSATEALQYSFNSVSLVNNQSITFTPKTYTYSWTGPNTFSAVVKNPSVTGATPAASGTYALEITDSNGCKASATTDATVHPTPTAVAPANQLYYNGLATAAITLSGTPSGVTFDISGGAGVGLNDATGLTSIPSFIPNTGSATVSITPKANGCTGAAVTYNIVVSSVSADPIANQEYCEGVTTAAIPLSYTPVSLTGVTYTILGGVSVGLADVTGVTSIPSFTAIPGSATITVIPQYGGVSGGAVTGTILVNPLPTATIAGSTPVCQNDTAPIVTFTGANGTAPYTFTYKFNNGSNQTIVSSGNTATIAQPTGTAGTFTYTLVSVKDSSSTTCSNAQSGTVTIIVHPTPTAVAPANQSYYSGFATAAIPLTGTPSGVTFNISGGAAAGLADVNGVTAVPSFIPTTTPATVTITPVANGCVGVPVTYQIAFNPVVVNIASNVCGSINNGLNNQINCTQVSVPGYTTTGYQFEVTNTATGEVAVLFSSQHHFKLTDSNNYAYGTTFTIRVAAVLNGQVQGYFGSTCSLTTASVQTSRVVTAQCGSTLVFINSTINANSVSSTNLYRFRVALASAPTVTYLVERTVPNFKLTDVVGLPLLYNTEYLVDVQIRVKLAGFEAWSQYGVRCSILTPAAPETSLVNSQCEDYLVPSTTSPISAIAFPGATAYRFRLTGYDEFGDVNYQQTVTNASPSFTLSQFSGLTPGATYTVSVAMNLFGTFTDYSKDCSIITPAITKQVVEPFKATAYPNPFAANFMIDVKTTSTSVIAIKVYDMVGRLVEQQTVTVTDLKNSPIGNNYPSGVYNVVVTQDETVQTVRVVKR